MLISHPHWQAITDLPGKRLTRRMTGKTDYEVVDTDGTVLAVTNKDSFTLTGWYVSSTTHLGHVPDRDANYTFDKAGLLDDRGRLVLPYPKPRSWWEPWVKLQVKYLVIELPDGRPRIEFRYRVGSTTLRWGTAEVLDEWGNKAIALRWRAEDLPARAMFGLGGLTKFKRVGEAVVAQPYRLPVEPLLLTCYAFWIFDRLSIAHG